MPVDKQLLLDKAAKLERLMAELTTIRPQHDGDRGKPLVTLRRRLSSQVAAIGSMVRPMPNEQDAGTRSTFSRLYSTLLSRLALH